MIPKSAVPGEFVKRDTEVVGDAERGGRVANIGKHKARVFHPHSACVPDAVGVYLNSV